MINCYYIIGHLLLLDESMVITLWLEVYEIIASNLDFDLKRFSFYLQSKKVNELKKRYSITHNEVILHTEKIPYES